MQWRALERRYGGDMAEDFFADSMQFTFSYKTQTSLRGPATLALRGPLLNVPLHPGIITLGRRVGIDLLER